MTALSITTAAADPAEIALGGKKAAGRVALVDAADYELVIAYRWHIWEETKPDGREGGPYAQTTRRQDGRKFNVRMHRLITGWQMTDHINHDGLNNQRL